MIFNKVSEQSPAQYPIFFRQLGSIEAGYPTTWVWQDRALSSEDVGPFDAYEDALASWAQTRFLADLERDLKTLDIALGSPIINPPTLSEADTERALEAMNQAEGQLSQQVQPAAVAESIPNPQSQPGRALLAWGLKDAAYLQLLDMGLELVEQMSSYRSGDGVTVALEQLQAGGVR
ncbi:MAG: hypothetical protein CVV27_10605 [Candidatus Melainabacteria bacterium HGW-Melainabacteria-1]|nr:MAG: hypothetical protein CVV27_10605 [Candidatus Melainabacteria bacterium HGW-Melainabacteria-1]